MFVTALSLAETTEALSGGGPMPLLLAGAVPVVLISSLTFWLLARRGHRDQQVPATEVPMAAPVSRKQVTELHGPQPMLEVVGEEGRVHRLRGSIVRIGRHGDNDVQLASQTVHRYHAVLHATPTQGHVITDLSGPEGNGVVVNGARIEHATLAPGDEIELGDVHLRFSLSEPR